MEQKITPEMIWKNFEGSRIVLAGVRNSDRALFGESLGTVASQMGGAVTVSDGEEQIREGDYVLLFTRTAVPDRKRKASEWTTKPEDWNMAADDWEETMKLLETLRSLPEKKPAGVLLISGNEVYGKMLWISPGRKRKKILAISAIRMQQTQRRSACAWQNSLPAVWQRKKIFRCGSCGWTETRRQKRFADCRFRQCVC